MMKKLITTIILALFMASNLHADKEHFYEKVLKQATKHERRDVRPYLNASFHVAKMWRNFPDPDFHQRVSMLFGYGGVESNFEPDYVNFNIPGVYLRGLNGLKVKRFSVDYGTFGLNEGNVNHTYQVARAIQTGHNISRNELLRMGLHPNLMIELKKCLRIPEGLSLYRIDLSTATDARQQYDAQKKAKVPPKKIRIHIEYKEDTQDKVDSVLLYRSIEQFDRYLRGWPWENYKSDAFRICQSVLSE